MLRLGQAQTGIRFLEEAEEKGIHKNSLVRCRIERLKALRLMGELKQAEDLAEQTRSLNNVSESDLMEIEWEQFCRIA